MHGCGRGTARRTGAQGPRRDALENILVFLELNRIGSNVCLTTFVYYLRPGKDYQSRVL